MKSVEEVAREAIADVRRWYDESIFPPRPPGVHTEVYDGEAAAVARLTCDNILRELNERLSEDEDDEVPLDIRSSVNKDTLFEKGARVRYDYRAVTNSRLVDHVGTVHGRGGVGDYYVSVKWDGRPEPTQVPKYALLLTEGKDE